MFDQIKQLIRCLKFISVSILAESQPIDDKRHKDDEGFNDRSENLRNFVHNSERSNDDSKVLRNLNHLRESKRSNDDRKVLGNLSKLLSTYRHNMPPYNGVMYNDDELTLENLDKNICDKLIERKDKKIERTNERQRFEPLSFDLTNINRLSFNRIVPYFNTDFDTINDVLRRKPNGELEVEGPRFRVDDDDDYTDEDVQPFKSMIEHGQMFNF